MGIGGGTRYGGSEVFPVSSDNKQLNPLKRLAAAYVSGAERRPWLYIFCLLLLTAGLGWQIRKLDIDTRIDALLPEGTPTQIANLEATERFAGINRFYLVVTSSDGVVNRQVVADSFSEVKAWPETVSAIRQRDPSFFLDRRLLFLDQESLENFADEVEDFVEFKKCEKLPGCILLDSDVDEPDIGALRAAFEKLPELKSLGSIYGTEEVNAGLPNEDGKTQEVTEKPEGFVAGELCSKDGSVCVIEVTLDREPSDLQFSREMVDRAEATLKSHIPAGAPADIRVAATGIYRNLPVMRDQVMDDLRSTFALGLGLVVLVLLIQFRKLRALILLLTPLFMGSTWALGVMAWVSPQLNMISAAGLVILAGLGIDFGLHMLTHYGAERESGQSVHHAVATTLNSLMSSLSVAALTTGCGFAALTAADFKGFAQLGIFSTIGITCTLLATFMAFPPFIFALHRLRPVDGALTRSWKMPGFLERQWPRGPAMLVTIFGLLWFGFGVYQVQNLELLYDTRMLIQKAQDTGIDHRPALGASSGAAVLMLADDQASLEASARKIRRDYPQGLSGHGEPSVLTPGLFIPDGQAERLEEISRLRDSVNDALRFGSDEWKEKLAPWKPLVAVTKPIVREDMPAWVLESLSERDGRFGTVGLIYQDFEGWDARQMLVLADKMQDLRKAHKKVRFASSSSVLGEVMPLLRADGWRVTALAMLGLLIATLLIGRSARRSILILTAIFLAVLVTVAFMVLFSWKVNFYNLLVFPVAFGIGVDGAIYVVWSVLGRKGSFAWDDLGVSSRAVFGSTLTTLVVFASLISSENGGLASLGKVATIALAVTLFANLIWLPAALSWMQHITDKSRKKKQLKSEKA